MGKIQEAFDNLLKTIEDETAAKFTELEQKVKAKRQATLKQDLADIEAQEKAREV